VFCEHTMQQMELQWSSALDSAGEPTALSQSP